jgi:hypothetical protein
MQAEQDLAALGPVAAASAEPERIDSKKRFVDVTIRLRDGPTADIDPTSLRLGFTLPAREVSTVGDDHGKRKLKARFDLQSPDAPTLQTGLNAVPVTGSLISGGAKFGTAVSIRLESDQND